MIPSLTPDCEIMAKRVCNTSLLKDTDYLLKREAFSHTVYTACDSGIREHVLLHIGYAEITGGMFDVIRSIDDEHVKCILEDHLNIFSSLLGKHSQTPFQSMLNIFLLLDFFVFIFLGVNYDHRLIHTNNFG